MTLFGMRLDLDRPRTDLRSPSRRSSMTSADDAEPWPPPCFFSDCLARRTSTRVRNSGCRRFSIFPTTLAKILCGFGARGPTPVVTDVVFPCRGRRMSRVTASALRGGRGFLSRRCGGTSLLISNKTMMLRRSRSTDERWRSGVANLLSDKARWSGWTRHPRAFSPCDVSPPSPGTRLSPSSST